MKGDHKNNGIDRLAAGIAGTLHRWQQKICDRLAILTAGLSAKGWTIGLILFCYVGACASLYVLVKGIMGSTGKTIRVEQPSTILSVPAAKHPQVQFPDSQLVKAISNYRHLMDSLRLPIDVGLTDSMRLHEEQFYSNH